MAFSISFSEEKSQLLEATRGINFDEIVDAIKTGGLLADIVHPSHRRPNQRVYVVEFKHYAYAVPYVINLQKKEIFLKTIYPSRALTRIYIQGGSHDED
ncbi:MAG TPA: hypothetical protein VGG13_01105 [Candidatus Saccharimonadales bacterium]|jgi:hypothetical protein